MHSNFRGNNFRGFTRILENSENYYPRKFPVIRYFIFGPVRGCLYYAGVLNSERCFKYRGSAVDRLGLKIRRYCFRSVHTCIHAHVHVLFVVIIPTSFFIKIYIIYVYIVGGGPASSCDSRNDRGCLLVWY